MSTQVESAAVVESAVVEIKHRRCKVKSNEIVEVILPNGLSFTVSGVDCSVAPATKASKPEATPEVKPTPTEATQAETPAPRKGGFGRKPKEDTPEATAPVDAPAPAAPVDTAPVDAPAPAAPVDTAPVDTPAPAAPADTPAPAAPADGKPSLSKVSMKGNRWIEQEDFLGYAEYLTKGVEFREVAIIEVGKGRLPAVKVAYPVWVKEREVNGELFPAHYAVPPAKPGFSQGFWRSQDEKKNGGKLRNVHIK